MEFDIGEDVKYVSYTGKVDVSPQQIKNLDDNPGPTYVVENVFLQVLLEGK